MNTANTNNTTNTNNLTKANRITGLDIYRIIACMLVVINHCNSKVMFQLTPMTLAWYVTVGVFYVTKIAVPGFLMIAGYNLLHRQDDWTRSFKRALRILVVMVVFSLLYYVWRSSGEGNFLLGFLNAFWHDNITDAYWYLYMYLGLMLVLPLLQKLANAMTREDFHVFFVATLIFVTVIPTISQFIPGVAFAETFNLPLVMTYGGCVAYMFFGHYFYKYGFKYPVWWPVVGFVCGFAMNMVISVMEFRATGGADYLSVGEIEYIPLMLESISMFAFLMWIENNRGYASVIVKSARFIAPQTFGIYLVSDFLCAETHFIYFNLCPYMNRLLAVAIEDVVVLAVGFIFVLAIRKIPVVAKYL